MSSTSWGPRSVPKDAWKSWVKHALLMVVRSWTLAVPVMVVLWGVMYSLDEWSKPATVLVFGALLWASPFIQGMFFSWFSEAAEGRLPEASNAWDVWSVMKNRLGWRQMGLDLALKGSGIAAGLMLVVWAWSLPDNPLDFSTTPLRVEEWWEHSSFYLLTMLAVWSVGFISNGSVPFHDVSAWIITQTDCSSADATVWQEQAKNKNPLPMMAGIVVCLAMFMVTVAVGPLALLLWPFFWAYQVAYYRDVFEHKSDLTDRVRAASKVHDA
jgi:hypothetical protein